MAHVVAKVAGLKIPTKSAKRLPRKEGAELLTLPHWKAVTVDLKSDSFHSHSNRVVHGVVVYQNVLTSTRMYSQNELSIPSHHTRSHTLAKD